MGGHFLGGGDGRGDQGKRRRRRRLPRLRRRWSSCGYAATGSCSLSGPHFRAGITNAGWRSVTHLNGYRGEHMIPEINPLNRRHRSDVAAAPPQSPSRWQPEVSTVEAIHDQLWPWESDRDGQQVVEGHAGRSTASARRKSRPRGVAPALRQRAGLAEGDGVVVGAVGDEDGRRQGGVPMSWRSACCFSSGLVSRWCPRVSPSTVSARDGSGQCPGYAVADQRVDNALGFRALR